MAHLANLHIDYFLEPEAKARNLGDTLYSKHLPLYLSQQKSESIDQNNTRLFHYWSGVLQFTNKFNEKVRSGSLGASDQRSFCQLTRTKKLFGLNKMVGFEEPISKEFLQAAHAISTIGAGLMMFPLIHCASVIAGPEAVNTYRKSVESLADKYFGSPPFREPAEELDGYIEKITQIDYSTRRIRSSAGALLSILELPDSTYPDSKMESKVLRQYSSDPYSYLKDARVRSMLIDVVADYPIRINPNETSKTELELGCNAFRDTAHAVNRLLQISELSEQYQQTL